LLAEDTFFIKITEATTLQIFSMIIHSKRSFYLVENNTTKMYLHLKWYSLFDCLDNRIKIDRIHYYTSIHSSLVFIWNRFKLKQNFSLYWKILFNLEQYCKQHGAIVDNCFKNFWQNRKDFKNWAWWICLTFSKI
jgi:hypothetical protein